ncbi:MAG: hypothetical protein K2K63_00660 [Acetatifactor sp.]|nr:hypothetical protein [Acetatifactor sp.]
MKKSKQRISFMTLLFILFLAGTGCGDGRQVEEPTYTSQKGGTETVSKTGLLSFGYFYGEEGIVLSSRKRFLFSNWEPLEFDYICVDPTCSHMTGNCSARTISGAGDAQNDFGLLYQGRLIILHAYSQFVSNESSETVWDYSTVYQTDVYEANPDGSNRRKMVTFQGAIDSPIIPYAAVLADGKLYFGGAIEVRNRTGYDIQGGGLTNGSWISDAVYCLDLNDYTLETFAVTEDRGGLGNQYQFYEYDSMIYGIISNFQEDSAVWYRIDPAVGGCEEILCFDSNVARFCGAIGDTVYYYYENSGKTLYAKDIAAGAKEREIMTITGEDMFVNTFILDGQILFMTDCCTEGEERMTEYAVLDRNGEYIDTIRYDDHVSFLDAVGEKLIYFRMYSDCDEWWVDKETLIDLTEKGVPIGPFYGPRLDTLGD